LQVVQLRGEVRTALSNMVWKAICLPIEKVSRLLLVVVAAPLLGQAGFGRFQFATIVTALLAQVMDLGLGVWTTRALARSRLHASTIVRTVLHLRALAVLPYVVLTVVAAFAVEPGDTRTSIAVLATAGIVNAFIDHAIAVFRGYERFDDETRLNAARALAVMAAALGATAIGRSVVALSTGVLLGTCAAGVYGLTMVRSRYRLLRSVDPGTVDRALGRGAAREALPIWLAGLVSMLYFKGDTLILRAFAGDAALGIYSAAYKLFEGSMLLPAILLAAVFPPLARAHGDPQRQGAWERLVFAVLLGLGLVVGATFYLGRARIIPAVFGAGFAEADASLRILALGIPVLYVNFGLTHFLIARDLGHKNLVFAVAMLILNVALNLIAIPRLGGPGAAWATVITEAALLICCLVTLRVGRQRPIPLPPAPAAANTGRAEA
jgi:O-antigen/teichoic acid export membrane protein